MPIEQLRGLLIVALCVVVFLMWQQWRLDYGPKPTVPTTVERTEEPLEPVQPDIDAPDLPDVPPADEAEPAQLEQPTDVIVTARGARVRVVTDVFDAEIGLLGGNLQRLSLLKYPVSLEDPEEPFALFQDVSPGVFVGQSGLLGESAAPNHRAHFRAERERYELGDRESLEVPLEWLDAGPLQVRKIYTFMRDSYLIGVRYEIRNQGDQAWVGRLYGQFQREEVPPTGGLFRTYTYTGGVISGPDKPYEKVDFGDMAKTRLERDVNGGWVAMIQHYFASAWLPDQVALNRFYSLEPDEPRYVIGLMTPPRKVAPGETGRLSLSLYAGPKIQSRMKAAAPNLHRTVDYGWLWVVAQPLFWLLDWIHSIVGNWGWSIILLTCLVKLAFFHLSATSYKSMARMRKVQPRIMALRERHSGDKTRMNQAMMELYKEEKINPLGGCLPIAVQIPVFIALYWVLLESVELRQASFIFWLDDLSVHDRFFVLPLMMGVSMFLQQKLNPAPPDPMQARIMMALPFVFTFLFLFFPSGLVLYWFVNNCLSITQQWIITRKIVGTT